jgi:hypothetical protein
MNLKGLATIAGAAAALALLVSLSSPWHPTASLAQVTDTPSPLPTEAPTPEPTAEPTPVPTEEPTAEPTEEPTLEPTAEPTEEPTATPEPEEEGDDEVVGGLTALQLILIAGAVLLAVVLIASLLASRRRRSASIDEWDTSLKESLGEARWVHDVLSLDIANRATNRPYDDIRATWLDGQRRVKDLESELYRIQNSAPEGRAEVPVSTLSDSLRALRETLESDLNMREPEAASAPGQSTLLDDSAALISQRRQSLLQAIQAIELTQS